MTTNWGLILQGSASIQGVAVFENIKLEVPSGEWTCLLGSSGVGKTTVLKLFAGLDEEIAFSGVCGLCEASKLEASIRPSLQGHVALMAQSDLLLPWLTAAQNIALGAKLRGDAIERARIADVLHRVGLSDKASSKPFELSGGQRQRIALARTLMEDRPVILLDEPFSALDARTRAQMQELAAELLRGRTVLLVTHDPAEAARLGQSIKVMMHNRIEDVSPPQGMIPRDFDAPEVLSMQTALLTRLRAEPAAQTGTTNPADTSF